MNILTEYFKHMVAVFPQLLHGALYTIGTAGIAEIIAIALGMTLTVGRIFGGPKTRFGVIAYLDVVRGTPLLVQILIIYFGIPGLVNGITGQPFSINPFLAGIIAFGLNGAAYLSEIFRAGINSVDKGQWEAALSLGFSKARTFIFIILPQAFRQSLPPMGNDFITLTKDTSLLSVIAVTEITKQGDLYVARTYAAFPTYLSIAIVYFSITFTMSRLVTVMEKRLSIP